MVKNSKIGEKCLEKNKKMTNFADKITACHGITRIAAIFVGSISGIGRNGMPL